MPDLITSSRDITFMEHAAPLQAMAPGILAGIQIGQPVFNERATWAFGLFAPGAGSLEYGNGVDGPFSLQGEFIRSGVGQDGAEDLSFYGFYGYASWFLTGESRPYDPVAGAFKRLIPRHNFNFGHGGWGSVEVTCRFSHTDLTDGNVQGGRLSLLMAGMNWYLHPHVKWMFNYGFGHATGGPSQGHMNIFQTRIGVDF